MKRKLNRQNRTKTIRHFLCFKKITYFSLLIYLNLFFFNKTLISTFYMSGKRYSQNRIKNLLLIKSQFTNIFSRFIKLDSFKIFDICNTWLNMMVWSIQDMFFCRVGIKHVGGDMFDYIPKGDAIFMKVIIILVSFFLLIIIELNIHIYHVKKVDDLLLSDSTHFV